ncbi:MAG TPA: hypothetical protein VK896_11550 [Gaiellaceae bacterium]|nr:hypothetical protein [Gaiellaceae bacterium]
MLRAEVEEEVVTDDDQESGGRDPNPVAQRHARQPARTPEHVHEPGSGNGVAPDGDVPGRDAIVEQRLDDGEGACPYDHDRGERQVRTNDAHVLVNARDPRIVR